MMLRATILFTATLLATALGATQERILNGDLVQSPEEYPFKCNLRRLGRFTCGCVIISDTWVLTSARCVDGFLVRDLSISVGSNHLNVDDTVYEVNSRTQHFDFQTNDFFSPDIAAVEVKGPMIMDMLTVGPVTLPVQDEPSPTGAAAVVIGWGFTAAGGPESPSLMEANATIMDHAQCASWYAGEGVISNEIVCTTNTGGGVCNNDNGGPLLVSNVLHGIITWTSTECATLQGFPGVYTRVASFRTWITDITGV
ncbi:hypothetical protein B566_EDAN009057 [Ephemera danica]|nr:hypothetical protein B566_EDAN009057 [Ephemera danica]